MKKLETNKLKADHASEIAELNTYHARELTATRTAHANQMTDLKEHSNREAVVFKQEIARLEQFIVRLEKVVSGLQAQKRVRKPTARKSRARRRK